ncbi:protein dj-1beta [Calliphora vicina]|uniref:protein dj-1beta n=1 Tax=Calliphora vicina TaxID=7373 RepID=UPI00325AC412
MSKTALIILAPGAEEMEFVISADVLRRAGVKVTVAGLSGTEPVKCSRDVMILPDTSLEASKSNKYDVVILPGGLGGSKAMAESAVVGEILKQQEAEGRIVAAICAAPTALAAHSICQGKSLTSYPSVKSQLEAIYKYVDDQTVVQDGNLITSRGPGTAFEFGLKIAEVLAGSDKAAEVAKGMLLK